MNGYPQTPNQEIFQHEHKNRNMKPLIKEGTDGSKKECKKWLYTQGGRKQIQSGEANMCVYKALGSSFNTLATTPAFLPDIVAAPS